MVPENVVRVAGFMVTDFSDCSENAGGKVLTRYCNLMDYIAHEKNSCREGVLTNCNRLENSG